MVTLSSPPPSSVFPFKAWVFALASLGVVGVSAAAYTGHIPHVFSSHGVDKALHATMTFTLTFLLARLLRSRAVLAGLIVMIPVGIDEYAQRFSTSRSSDWLDLAADLVGVLLAIFVVHRTTRRRLRPAAD